MQAVVKAKWDLRLRLPLPRLPKAKGERVEEEEENAEQGEPENIEIS